METWFLSSVWIKLTFNTHCVNVKKKKNSRLLTAALHGNLVSLLSLDKAYFQHTLRKCKKEKTPGYSPQRCMETWFLSSVWIKLTLNAHCVIVKKKKLPVTHRSVAWKPGFSSQFG
jgi:hypothetical protein